MVRETKSIIIVIIISASSFQHTVVVGTSIVVVQHSSPEQQTLSAPLPFIEQAERLLMLSCSVGNFSI